VRDEAELYGLSNGCAISTPNSRASRSTRDLSPCHDQAVLSRLPLQCRLGRRSRSSPLVRRLLPRSSSAGTSSQVSSPRRRSDRALSIALRCSTDAADNDPVALVASVLAVLDPILELDASIGDSLSSAQGAQGLQKARAGARRDPHRSSRGTGEQSRVLRRGERPDSRAGRVRGDRRPPLTRRPGVARAVGDP
jgi:hypothetical protein